MNKETMDMIEQYKKETLQIHAPADLILRTKQAVEEEEKRIQQETMWRNTAAQASRESDRKMYRWAFTAAAVALFVLFGASAIMLENRVSKSGMSGSADTGMMDGMAESADMEVAIPDKTAELEGTNSLEQTAGSANTNVTEQSVESAKADGGLENKLTNGAAASASMDLGDSVDDAADGYEIVSDEFEEEREYTDRYEACKTMEKDRIEMSIEKVDEIPSFYKNPDTECVILNGIVFYVIKEQDDKWSAYVHIDGEKYVIVGGTDEFANQEIFIEGAYELLIEEMGGTE